MCNVTGVFQNKWAECGEKYAGISVELNNISVHTCYEPWGNICLGRFYDKWGTAQNLSCFPLLRLRLSLYSKAFPDPCAWGAALAWPWWRVNYWACTLHLYPHWEHQLQHCHQKYHLPGHCPRQFYFGHFHPGWAQLPAIGHEERQEYKHRGITNVKIHSYLQMVNKEE